MFYVIIYDIVFELCFAPIRQMDQVVWVVRVFRVVWVFRVVRVFRVLLIF
jgi:hypothetical protein